MFLLETERFNFCSCRISQSSECRSEKQTRTYLVLLKTHTHTLYRNRYGYTFHALKAQMYRCTFHFFMNSHGSVFGLFVNWQLYNFLFVFIIIYLFAFPCLLFTYLFISLLIYVVMYVFIINLFDIYSLDSRARERSSLAFKFQLHTKV
jgi:hypothetical protein